MTARPRRRTDVVVAVALAGALALLVLAWRGSQETVLLDMDGRRIAVDAGPAAGAADVRATGGRFQAPRQDLDVPLLEMTPAAGVLNPPTLTDAFLVRNAGRAPSPGARPRVVVLHAVQGGRAPGNALLSADGRAAAVHPGDELRVDGVRYTVTGTEILPQADAAASPAVWADHDDGRDRLVVLTCVTGGTRGGPATHNLVVHAAR